MPIICGNSTFTAPGATESMPVWPEAFVSVTVTAAGCGFDTTIANGDFCAFSEQIGIVWQV